LTDVNSLCKVIHFRRGLFNPLSNRFDDLSKSDSGNAEISFRGTENKDYCLFLHVLKTRQDEESETYCLILFAAVCLDGSMRQTHPDGLRSRGEHEHQ
jgi:hypothetical protein